MATDQGQTESCYDIGHYDLLYANHVAQTPEALAIAKRVIEHSRAPKRVLVIGCGTGGDVVGVYEPGWNAEYLAFDLVPSMIEATQRRLEACQIKADLWVGDLLQSGFNHGEGDLKGTIDLAVFRGNCFAHLEPADYAKAFANGYRVLAPEGQFLFDYRDGHEYFASEPLVEMLGSGYNAEHSLYHYSAYLRNASSNKQDPYHLKVVLTVWGEREYARLISFNAQGYYVLPEVVEQAWQQAGFSCQEITEQVGASFRCLRTFIAQKGA